MKRFSAFTAVALIGFGFGPHNALAELKIQIHQPATTSSASPRQSRDTREDEGKNENREAKPSKPSQEEQSKDDSDDDAYEGPETSVDRYGTGDTVSSRESYRERRGVVDQTVTDETGTTYVRGETRLNETRARTYEERGLLSYKTGAQAQANLVRSEYHTGYESPAARIGGMEVAKVRTQSSAEAFVGAQADAEVGVDLDPRDPRLEANAGVFVGARVDTESKAEVEVLGASASTTTEGSASVGAEASVNGSLSTEGGEVKAGAFAGARAEGAVGGEVGGVGAEARGEAWAGVGAEAEGTATFEDGKLTFGGDVGGGLGVGGKVGYTTTVDVNKVHHDGTALIKNGSKLIEETAPKLNPPIRIETGRSPEGTILVVRGPQVKLPRLDPKAVALSRGDSTMRRALEDATHQVRQAHHQGWPRAGRPVENTVQDVRRRAGQGSQTAKQIGRELERGTNQAGTQIGHSANKIGSQIGRAGSKVGNQIGRSAKKGGTSVRRTTKKVASSAKKLGKKFGLK